MYKCNKKDCCCEACGPCLTDCLAKQIECLWKSELCGVDPHIISLPSQTCGVLTISFNLKKYIGSVKIDGIKVKSPLANNCTLTCEVSDGKWVNCCECQIPDIPGKCGCKSSGEVYTEALSKMNISLGGDSYKFKGEVPKLLCIDSIAIGMDPIEFSKKEINALKAVIDNYICKC